MCVVYASVGGKCTINISAEIAVLENTYHSPVFFQMLNKVFKKLSLCGYCTSATLASEGETFRRSDFFLSFMSVFLTDVILGYPMF